MTKDFNEDIHKALSNDIQITEKDTEDMWSHIENELFVEKAPTKFKRTSRYTIPSIASIAILFLTFQTESGNALIDKFKNLYDADKVAQVTLEVEEEKVDIALHPEPSSNQTFSVSSSPIEKSLNTQSSLKTSEVNQLAEYIIDVNKEIYQVSDEGEVKYISPKISSDNNYPEPSMEIRQTPQTPPASVIAELAEELKTTYNIVSEINPVDVPTSGFMVWGNSGSEWNSDITKYYVFDNQSGGSFIVTMKYLFESEVEHGAGFNSMLKGFKIIGSD